MPTRIELAYLAGIIDGEGSIMLQRSNARSSSAHIYPVIKICNTNQKLGEWLKERFDFGAWQYKSKIHLKCKDVFHWTVASNQAIELLEQVRPYLILKAHQADVVLAMWAENEAELKLHGRPFGNYHPLPDRLRHFREACYWYMRDLNHRGIAGFIHGDKVMGHVNAIERGHAS